MGDFLFDRRCRLTIANPVSTPNDFQNTTTDVIEIDGGVTDDEAVAGMRVKFKITKTLKKEPNTSEIVVTNLSPDRRKSLQQKGVKVMLEAGYRDTGVAKIFSGDVRSVDHIRDAANFDTTLKLGDGERAWNFARVAESFSPGTRAADVFKSLAKATGLDLGNVSDVANGISAQFDQGYCASGSAAREFDRIVTSLGLTWSTQDGILQVLDPDGTLDAPIPEITPDSGLVDSPEMGSPNKKGKPTLVTFKSLLQPVKPGGKVKLRSERYDGNVKVKTVVYEGDTHGGEWYVTIAGEVLK